MALQDITTKILDDGASRVQEIVKSTQGEITALQAEQEKLDKDATRANDAHVVTLLAAAERSALSRARRDARQMVSTEKRTLINRVKEDATAAIVNADDTVYTSFLTSLLADFEPDTVVTTVHAPAARLDLTKKVLTERGVSAPIVADDAIAAGMIFVGEKADYDFTLARRMHDLTTELEAIIVKNIFAQ